MELTLFIDHQCNLRCTYCYNGEKFTRRMSSETMQQAVALALQSTTETLSVSFFGGEPLLHLDFVRETLEHVEQAVAQLERPVQVGFVMNTNATLIDDEAIELMSPPRRFAVYVSVDGDRETHDRVRVTPSGQGSFDDVAAGLERLHQAEIPFHILAVVTPTSAPRLGDGMRAILKLRPSKMQLSVNYRDAWTDESIELLRGGLRDVGDAWMDLFRAGTALPVNPLHSKILAHLKGGMPCPSRCLLGGCEFTVTPTGRMYPCAQMVGEDDGSGVVIGQVDKGGMDLTMLPQLQQAKDRVEEICGDCELRDRCQSQCGCRHLALTGKLGEITATLCETEAAFIDEADRVAETLYAEECQSFIDYYYKRTWNVAPGGKVSSTRVAPTE